MCGYYRCGRALPEGIHGNVKYCPGSDHGEKQNNHDSYLRKKALKTGLVPGQVSQADSADGRASARRGRGYEAFCLAGWPARIKSGEFTPTAAADVIGTSQANVSRWLAAWQEDSLNAARAGAWGMDPEVASSLAPFLPDSAEEIAERYGVTGAERLALVGELVEQAAESFGAFRMRFFRTAKDKPYLTPDVHRRWIVALLRTLVLGGRQLILSPPRHGKSELCAHLSVWLICRNPNIRIIWVGGNEKVAQLMVGSVLDHLENNEQLIAEVLGPGGSFKPPSKSGRSWSPSQLTTASRTAAGIKSPTIVALGKGATILSRDADLIVFDDVIDHRSVQSPTQRDDDYTWLVTQLSSRKEEETAMIGIGSRQHHQDAWGRLVRNTAWSVIVEHAHDPTCVIPVHPSRSAEEHLECPECDAHVDCLLFPELRSMRWLQDARTDANDDLKFEMVYQNITRPEGADPVTIEHIEACRSTRRIGDIPPGCTLIAGHDPASAGVQGNVLWAVDTKTMKRHLVDLEAQKGGGTPAFRQILKDWHERYGLKLWVAEAQNNSDAIQQDRDITDYTTKHGITILASSTTRYTKWSPDFGVPVQLALFKRRTLGENGEWVLDPLINIPFGDEMSRDKVRPYEQQVMNFEPGAKNNGDLLMAGWMPENEIRDWRYQDAATVTYETDDLYPGSPAGETYMTLGDTYDYAA